MKSQGSKDYAPPFKVRRVAPKLDHYKIKPKGFDIDHPLGQWQPGHNHWWVNGLPACKHKEDIPSHKDAPSTVNCLGCIEKYRD